MFLCEFWEIFKNTFFHRTFAKDTILSSFFLGLNEEGSNLNHGNNVETALNSELPIVAEIARSTETEIFKLKIPFTSIITFTTNFLPLA